MIVALRMLKRMVVVGVAVFSAAGMLLAPLFPVHVYLKYGFERYPVVDRAGHAISRINYFGFSLVFALAMFLFLGLFMALAVREWRLRVGSGR